MKKLRKKEPKKLNEKNKIIILYIENYVLIFAYFK